MITDGVARYRPEHDVKAARLSRVTELKFAEHQEILHDSEL